MHVIAISGNLMGLATWFFIISASRGFSELIPGARAVRCRGRRGDKVAVVLGGGRTVQLIDAVGLPTFNLSLLLRSLSTGPMTPKDY
jgi:hypothetical protein